MMIDDSLDFIAEFVNIFFIKYSEKFQNIQYTNIIIFVDGTGTISHDCENQCSN